MRLVRILARRTGRPSQFHRDRHLRLPDLRPVCSARQRPVIAPLSRRKLRYPGGDLRHVGGAEIRDAECRSELAPLLPRECRGLSRADHPCPHARKKRVPPTRTDPLFSLWLAQRLFCEPRSRPADPDGGRVSERNMALRQLTGVSNFPRSARLPPARPCGYAIC